MASDHDTLARYIRVRSRYQRAANLERDAGRDEALLGYLVTPAVRRALAQITTALESRSRERAWALTGPYGSGKTAFAVFLADLLAPDNSSARTHARRLLGQVDSHITTVLRPMQLHPVLVTGERGPLDLLLVRALDRAMDSIWSTKRGAKPLVLRRIRRLLGRLTKEQPTSSASDVARAYEDAFNIVLERTGAGFLLVLDEAGKPLECAAQHPERGDIFVLQALAECAGRTGNGSFLFLTILHQAFEQYCARLGSVQRNEWAKIQGRFGTLLFQDRADQIVRLTGAAIEPLGARPMLPGWRDLVETVAGEAAQCTSWNQTELSAALDQCWPLHPITALLLGPLFRGPLSQNERSLFAFLASGEPHGFREFVHAHETEALYAPDRLYDYVMTALGDRVFAHDGRAWAAVETALRRLPPDATELDSKVLKTCGLLAILGDQVGLRPAAATIAKALGDDVGVRGALNRLARASLLVYRKFRDAFYLWEGSDLDVEGLVRNAQAQLPSDLSIAATLTRLLGPRPLVARRHLVQTGTLRYFEVHFADTYQLHHGLELPKDPNADGSVVMAVPTSAEHASKLKTALTDPLFLFTHCKGDAPLLVGVPPARSYLIELAREFSALEQVLTTTPALQSDPVARKELGARLAEVETALEEESHKLFGVCEWFTQGGTRLTITSSRHLTRLLSDLCDRAYSKAAPIRNELVNRRVLSSAAAKARRNVLEAMVLRRQEHRLGFAGHPPEVSVYRSVLEATGLHREVNGQWIFTAPPAGSPACGAWAEIEKFLAETEGYRRPVAALYDRLRRPPFGIKDGVLPLLACAAFLTFESELALYERGSFVPQLSPSVLERLLRTPDQFEIRRSRIAGARLALLERLSRVLLAGARQDRATLLDLVRGMLKFTAALPEYARRTSTVSPVAAKVREALLTAREPAQLLFAQLPNACGHDAFAAEAPADPVAVERFLATLRASLGELQNAYAALLGRFEQILAQSFGASPSGKLRHDLRVRAERALPLTVDPGLKAFLIRLADDALEQDEWLVSLATHLASKPPAEWHDLDEQQCEIQLALLSRRFRTIEALVASQESSTRGGTLLRVAVSQPGTPEQERVIALSPERSAALESARSRFLDIARQLGASMNREEVLAGLALATQELLAEAERADTSAMGKVS